MISLVLVASILALVIFVWYPSPYFGVMGVKTVMLILALVDVTIGPLITLIIFNPKKKSLKIDLAIVAVLQLAALLYGTHTVFIGRPAYVVYNMGMFTLVSANDIPQEELNKMGKSLPLLGPKVVGAKLPQDNQEREKLLFSSVQGGLDLPQMPRYYFPYEQLADEVKARMSPLDVLMKRESKEDLEILQDSLDKVSRKHDLHLTDLAFVPMRGKVKDLTVLVKRSDASIVEILPINPW